MSRHGKSRKVGKLLKRRILGLAIFTMTTAKAFTVQKMKKWQKNGPARTDLKESRTSGDDY